MRYQFKETRLAVVRRLVGAGIGYHAIAYGVRCSYSTVNQDIRRMGGAWHYSSDSKHRARRIALHSHLTRPSKNDDQVIG